MNYEYEDQKEYIIKKENELSNYELDTIIRLIPKATPRQTEIIEGQIQIHKQITQSKEYKK